MKPVYRIQILKNGECRVPDWCVFRGERSGKSYPFALFVWAVHGGEKPILVETTCEDVARMNRDAAHVMTEPITLGPGEDPESLMAAARVDPREVSHVFITHLHYDHCSNMRMFPNATMVISATGYQIGTNPPGGRPTWLHHGFIEELHQLEAEGRLLKVDDTEVLPGIRVMHLGGHSPCSQAVIVNTRMGEVALAGDNVMLYRNWDENIPVGLATSEKDASRALQRLRKMDVIVVPGHDPDVLRRYPTGFIG